MKIPLYHADSYIKEFQATVTGVDADKHAFTLDQTAFYPGGGGQLADKGQIITSENLSISVDLVKKIDGEIFHFADTNASLPTVGTLVNGILDWEHRYAMMRTHTAMHILCGVVFRDYGASVTGGNMDPLKGRMDFEFENMGKELVVLIEAAVNEEVKKCLPISARVLPREDAFQIPDLIRTKINLLPIGIDEIRVVEIEGLDLQADGGTHVRNTSEVGSIRIPEYKSKGKINKRIYVELT